MILYCPQCRVCHDFVETGTDVPLLFSKIKGGFKNPRHIRDFGCVCDDCGTNLAGKVWKGKRWSLFRGWGEHELEVVTLSQFEGKYFWMKTPRVSTEPFTYTPSRNLAELKDRLEKAKHPDYDKYYTW